MFEVIPVLTVATPCHWSDAQKCFVAGVWWGELLIGFYTTDESRLESNRMNEDACRVLQKLTEAIKPDADEVLDSDALIKAMGDTVLCCYWEDFTPAVAMAYRNKCRIPI